MFVRVFIGYGGFFIFMFWYLFGSLIYSRCLMMLNVFRLGYSRYLVGCKENVESIGWRLWVICLESSYSYFLFFRVVLLI